MSRTHYQIYKEQTFVLAKTLIVKHEEIASSMNTELYYRGYVIDSNPYNWRYYLNLSGEYHQADKDELYEQHGTEYIMIKLPSNSGPVDVPLTKDLLHGENADKAMMNEYQIGSKFYTELVSRYPNFETLIIGILNPIERSVAIKADNGEILFIAGRYKKIQGERKWFDTTWYSLNEVLIEPQEDNLIFELQRYVSTFLRHWNNPEYMEGNDLYAVTMLGVLYCNIPNAIFNIRLGNCKTVRAHTFHIRQYLESHGQIGRYVDFIPIASSLWLYRNIEYLEANTGKQLTFDAIMDNVLTPNEIPMSAYSVRHELSNMGDDKLLPTGMLYKEILNFEVVGASDDDRTVLDILEDQVGLARDNHKDLDLKEIDIQDAIDWGGDDRLNTKVLESEMMELGEPYPFTLAQFLVNMWGYTAIKGYYTGSAFATNPLTGDRMSFSSKNAYILAHYCLNKGVAGIELERIPPVRLYQIPKTNQPLDLPTDKTFGLKPDINKIMSWCVSSKTRRLKALEVVGTHIPKFYAQDGEAFFSNVHDIYDERVRRYNTYCDVEEVEERGDLELIAKRMYWVNFQETLLDMSYEDWFRTVGFNPGQFNDNDLLNLGLELVASATGVVDQDNIRKKWLQKSLLAIMKHFISYTVHVIEKFSDGVVTYLEGQTIRYSDFKWNYIDGLPVKYSIAIDYNVATLVKQRMRIDVSNAFENAAVDINATVNTGYDLSNLAISQTAQKLHIGTYALSAEISNIEFNTEQAEPVFIVVIDNVVNAFTISGMNAVITDESRVFNYVTKQGLIPQAINLMAVDAFINRCAKDENKDSLIVDDLNAVIRDSRPVDKPRIDTETVNPSAISAIISDVSIKVAGFIDSMGHLIKDIVGKTSDELNDFITTRRDLSSLNLSHFSGGMSDDNVSLSFKDASILTASVTKVMSVDPQIPDIVAPSDFDGAMIGSISGKNTNVNIDYQSNDVSSMVLFNLSVDVLEDSVGVNPEVDTHAIALGSISVTSNETEIVPAMSDMYHGITTGDIAVDVSDVAFNISVVDSNGIIITEPTGTIVDNVDTTNTSNDSIDLDNITGQIEDSSVDTIVSLDRDRVDIADVSVSVVDVPQTTIIVDNNATAVTPVNLQVTDSDVRVSVESSENDFINITDVTLTRTDKSTSYGVDDVNAVTVTTISGKSVDGIITPQTRDNSAAQIYMNNVKVDVIDDDTTLTFTDQSQVRLRDTEVSVSVIEHDVLNDQTDLSKIDIDVNKINIAIDDEDAAITIPTVVDSIYASIDVQNVSIENIETIKLGQVTDATGTMIDVSQVTVEYIETLSVSTHGESNELLVNISDVKLEVIDTLSILNEPDNNKVVIGPVSIQDNVDTLSTSLIEPVRDTLSLIDAKINTADDVSLIVMTDANNVVIGDITISNTIVDFTITPTVDNHTVDVKDIIVSNTVMELSVIPSADINELIVKDITVSKTDVELTSNQLDNSNITINTSNVDINIVDE